MNTVTRPLAPSVAALFDRVSASPGRASATVDGHLVEAEDAAELRRELATWIYQILHAGQPPNQPDLPFHSRDRHFESRLVEALTHQWSTVRLPLLALADETAVVLREGVRVRILRERILGPSEPEPGSTVAVRIPAHRALLSPGFLFVDGTRTSASAASILRMYAHVRDAEAAVDVWRRILPCLEDSGAPYRIKVLSTPVLYPRRDALVVYLDGAAAAVVPQVIGRLRGMPELGEETPAFAEQLAPGLSIAWEPADPRREYRGLSFGQHRAHVLTDVLFEAMDSGDLLEDVVHRRFAEANIDPTNASRNADTQAT